MISAWNEHTANERKIARVVKKYADKFGVDSAQSEKNQKQQQQFMTVEEVQPVVSALRCKEKRLKLHSQNDCISFCCEKVSLWLVCMCVYFVRFASCVYVCSVCTTAAATTADHYRT